MLALNPKWGCLHQIQGFMQKRKQKTCNIQRANAHMISETVTSHTRPIQIQARQNPSMENRGWVQSPTPKKEPVLGPCWERENHAQKYWTYTKCTPCFRVCPVCYCYGLVAFVFSVFVLLVCLERKIMKLCGKGEEKDLGGLGGGERI